MHPVYALTLAVLLSAQDPLARIDQEAAKVVPAVTEIRHLGQVKAGTTSGDHHTPTFLDDSAIPIGIRAMSTVILDYLSRHK